MKICPKCNGPVQSDFACHTWPRTRDNGTIQWMACLPCDSATSWYCIAWQPDDELDEWMIPGEDEGSGCGWHWIENLNRGNPRSKENDLNKPEWSVDGSVD